MSYIENPKTKGSGILCCLPQSGQCPNKCPECFFQNGRSYLEPLEANLPNMPTPEQAVGHIIRVNDGNDSNIEREKVIAATDCYPDRFFNTAIPRFDFPGPVVLTINSGHLGTDERFYSLDDCGQINPPPNLMFVRVLVNTWNANLVARAVRYWADWEVPVVLTFMAYHKKPRRIDQNAKVWYANEIGYVERKRTSNTYWAITTKTWREIMARFQDNKLVYSCGRIEGEKGDTHCRFCGNCLREYYATKIRMGL